LLDGLGGPTSQKALDLFVEAIVVVTIIVKLAPD
jgi:hypothetical protein